jgi:hypothetical protein
MARSFVVVGFSRSRLAKSSLHPTSAMLSASLTAGISSEELLSQIND